jgi:hypothetical protein
MAIFTDSTITPGSTAGTLSKIVGTEYLPSCPPMTIGAWVYIDPDPSVPNPILGGNTNAVFAGIARNSTNRGFGLAMRNSGGIMGYVPLHWNGSSGRLVPFLSGSSHFPPHGQWNYVCASLDNTGGITACWVNEARIYSGYSDTFSTNTVAVDMNTGATPWDRISMMALRRDSINNIVPNGVAVAEAAWWDVRLSNEEIRSLAKGIKPTKIRPESLVEYIPGIRTSNDGLTGTSVNTTVIGQNLDAAAPGGGNYVPVNFKHPRRYG